MPHEVIHPMTLPQKKSGPNSRDDAKNREQQRDGVYHAARRLPIGRRLCQLWGGGVGR